MKFLVPNYSCLQNPWLVGYSSLCPLSSTEFVELPPPPNKIRGYATDINTTGTELQRIYSSFSLWTTGIGNIQYCTTKFFLDPSFTSVLKDKCLHLYRKRIVILFNDILYVFVPVNVTHLRHECHNSKFGIFELLVQKETFADALLTGIVS